ncbi:dihydropteroate synthase [Coxiella endosymbiont of Amblyomma nuttalli]|uniref:dihydropteroate synthase n=1 Tax=Coxiella endosymbiont of Amblyomma nuttalli TaxID=2749996 RepID=UPI001BB6A348|nr:dihydropteroate synthase [Coxiella endosymbiont of Amblyomma nuttalli]QTS83859.1 Dihydropteroate synthase [Coxiella endosymbiont of Amblyomma nuttalli]
MLKEKQFHLRLCDGRRIFFAEPAIMGIINVSPNSFYNPHSDLNSVLHTAEKMIAEGADILDIGAEATNPFVNLDKDSPSLQKELDRLIPAVDAIKKHFNILISVDTSRPQVMLEAVKTGADMINDQRALQTKEALVTVAELKTPVCLMHFPNSIRKSGFLSCSSFLKNIKHDLKNAIERCSMAGISQDRIIIDPGFGQGNYGKNLTINFYLLNKLSELTSLNLPILAGWSRKSMVGDIINQPPTGRLFGSIAADTLAVYQGASVIRTHDVKASREAVKIAVYAKRINRDE